MLFQTPVEIPLDSPFRVATSKAPSIRCTNAEMTPEWFYRHGMYCLSFFNQGPDFVGYSSVVDEIGSTRSSSSNKNPIQFMLRMMSYYLGEQPNIDYAYVTDDLATGTAQAMWIRNQNTKEFVDYFRGIILSMLQGTKWSGKPLSKRASTEYTNMLDKAMMSYDMKPFLKKMADEHGVDFNPTGQDFSLPEEAIQWTSTDWKQTGSEICQDLANGLWQYDGWFSKALQSFMNVFMTGHCAFEHIPQNGVMTIEPVMPYQLLRDIRCKDDYGHGDQFIGKVDCASPNEIFTRYPEFTEAQRADIEQIANNYDSMPSYNTMPNLTWINAGTRKNTVSYASVYLRVKRNLGKKAVENSNGNSRVAKSDPSDPSSFIQDDVIQVHIIANKYIARFGLIDNLVEQNGRVSRPLLPITRYQPNTFMGQSVSEVARIHRIIDEIDYIEYKIREMIGNAKGKKYVVDGSKFDDSMSSKSIIQELTSVGITVLTKSGEPGDKREGGLIDVIDWTLDPNINKLAEYVTIKEDKMRKIMSTSDVSMGQRQQYLGNNTMQSTIDQNQLGSAYLVNGFMDHLVQAMLYSVNATKNIATTEKTAREISFLIGDRGLVFLKFWDSARFEQMMVALNINDKIDKQDRAIILDIAKQMATGGMIDLTDIFKVMSADSRTEAINMLEYSKKARMQQQQQQQQTQEQSSMKMIEMQKQLDMNAIEFKEYMANYREEIKATVKTMSDALKLAQSMPPPQSITSINQMQQQQAQQQQAQQQGQGQPDQGPTENQGQEDPSAQSQSMPQQ